MSRRSRSGAGARSAMAASRGAVQPGNPRPASSADESVLRDSLISAKVPSRGAVQPGNSRSASSVDGAVLRGFSKRHAHAPVFAALGDETRLSLVAKLCNTQRYSISQLTEGSRLTRQAITKHLRVLERAGIVHSVRTGRESVFEFDPEPIEGIREYLDRVSEQWDQALARLKAFVED